MRRAGFLFALASAGILAGCGSGSDVLAPKPNIESLASVAGVTLPESLVAGDSVTVYVHYFYQCPYRFDRFELHEDSTGYWRVDMIQSHPDEPLMCLAFVECRAVPQALRLQVPMNGVVHYRVTGAYGDLPFDLQPSTAPGPEHRVTFIASDGTAASFQAFDYWSANYSSPDTVVASAITDSKGTAIVSPPPCPATTDSWVQMEVRKAGRACGFGVLLMDPYVPLCGRAMRTITYR